MRKAKQLADDICEDYCFLCKDGGDIRGCDYKNCLKAYHPECIEKDVSFLESNEKWDCAWHTCFICKNSAVYQCYCCPNSVCQTCMKEAEFVPLNKQNNKGFCNNCLRLAILIEENIDVDSDGGKVDFTDTETFEYLFKEYWELVKEKEGLSLQDLKTAKKYLKKGKRNINPSDSAEIESEKASEDYIPESSDSFHPGSESRRRKSSSKKEPNSKPFLLLNKKGAKKRNFIGWGSEELINFLSSINKDTSELITQSDACGIVEGYIERNNLYHPVKKRKMVISDGNLRKLFGKGKFKTAKIYKMLESHFPGNEDDEGLIFFREDEREEDEREKAVGNPVRKKRKAPEATPVQQVHHIREQYSEAKRRCRARLVRENMDIIFLRRSVILDLLKDDPNTFEEKVKGCFVRVKHDPKDFYVKPRNLYQVGQVTGVIKGREEYKVGDVGTNILLEISNKDMKLSSVTEESFDEMDLNDLKELARKGVFKMPTVGKIEDKLKVVHEFIMRDWIKRELVKLPKLISVANSKGRWDEKYEYMERKKLLEKPEEQERRIREMPVLIADPEEEKKIEEQDNEKDKTVFSPDSLTPVQNTVIAKGETSSQKVVPEASGKAQVIDKTPKDKGLGKDKTVDSESSNTPKPETNGNGSAVVLMKNSCEEIKVDDSNPISTIEATSMQIEEFQIPNLNSPEQSQTLLSSLTVKAKDPKPSNASPVIIDLSDSDEEPNDQNTPEKKPQEGNKGSNKDVVWYYMDPQGEQQGPFSVEMLRKWRNLGYFEDDFEVWRTGQSSEDSVLLLDVLGISR
ncbi:hypothetical protein LUZ60_001887 [Juncus effusus]|nr:hypothetical protein LUZ60_001887 [Juncus effusus]